MLTGHAMVLRQNLTQNYKTSPGNTKIADAIPFKEFGQNDKNGTESQTWKNRELDWFNTERRFIFGCKTKAEMERWVNNFNEDQLKRKL
jgi:hypothetical protein